MAGARRSLTMAVAIAALVVLSAVTGLAGGRTSRAGAEVRPQYHPVITRIQGADRYETAARIAERGWPDGSEYVVIATGQNFPDALAGAPLAHAYGAPILLTRSTSLPETVKTRIEALGATKAVILGGTAAVSTAVEGDLDALLGAANVDRISGADRYDTAARVAARVAAVSGLGGKVVIATGVNYPDALAIAGYAAARHYPILLTRPTALPAQTSAALSSLGATSTIVVGGTAAVSDAVKTQLPTPVRWDGVNRYATSVRIAEGAVADGMSWAELIVATGTNFPDALGAGPLTARFGGVTVLTDSTDLCAEAEACIEARKADIDEVILVGGTAAISQSAEAAIGALVATALSEWSAAQRAVSSAAYSSTLYGHNVNACGDAGGDLHIVWQEGTNLVYKRLNRFGATLVHDTVVEDGLSTTYRSYPSVTVANGLATLVWRRPSGGETVEGIRAAQIDAAGRMHSTPRRLLRIDSRYAEVAADTAGGLHVVTIEREDPARPLYARYDADLSPAVPWTPLTTIARDQLWTRTPRVAARGDGTVDIAWFDRRDPTLTLAGAYAASYYDVYLSRLAAGTAALDSTSIDQARIGHRVGGFVFDEKTDNSSGDSYAPGLAIGADGSTHVSWLDARSDVYYTRIGADGSTAAPQSLLVDRASSTASMDPTALCTVRADGGADIVYPDAFLGSGVRMAQVRVDALGRVVGAPERIPGASVAPQRFHVVRGPDGERAMVYIGDAATDKLYYLDTRRDDAAWDTSRCDLAIDDAHTPYQDPALAPRSGDEAHIETTVFNTGWAASPATTWRATYGGVQVASGALPPIAAGASSDIEFDWTVPSGLADAEQYVTITLDPAASVVECSEENNSVAHRVIVWPRPAGAGIAVHGTDETGDPTHAAEYVNEVPVFSATLSGTASEPVSTPWSRTVNATGGWAFFGTVPPGTYTLTASADEYTAPAPQTVTVARDAGDEYVMTVDPGDSPTAWFDTWGTFECGVEDSQGTPDPADDTKIAGATVRIRPGGREALTSAGSAAVLDQVAAGSYLYDVSAPGFEPLFDRAVDVDRAQTTQHAVDLDPTTHAWVEITVTNQFGTPMSGAMVELRDSGHAILASGVSSSAGNVRLHAVAADIAYVDVNKTLWVEQEWPVALDSGDVHRESVAMDPTSSVGYVHSDWGRWILTAMYYEMNGNEWWGFWRNFHNRFDLVYRTEGLDTYVTQIDAYARGRVFTWSCSAWQVDIDTPVGNIPELDWQIPVPQVGESANVLVERVKIVDGWSGEELWTSSSAGSWYSHDGIDEENVAVMMVEDTEPGVGVEVPWSTAKVVMWVNVQMAVADETGSDGWQSMPTGGTGKAMVVWTPSTNQMYVQPWLYDPW